MNDKHIMDITTTSISISNSIDNIEKELENLQNDYTNTKIYNDERFGIINGEISNIKSCCDARFNYIKSEMEKMEDGFTKSIKKLTKFTYISLSSLLILELIPLIMILNS